MFAKAYELASGFTRPVVISNRFFDGTVDCGCGAFIVVNDEGWIVTVAHLWQSYFAYKEHAKEISDYHEQIRTIEGDPRLGAKKKRKKIGRVKANPKWVTNHSFWWGGDGVQLNDVRPFPEGDLVVGRLEPFDPTSISFYPVFKDPTSNLCPGTSLCKLGFPLHEIDAAFDEANDTFKLAPDALPLPRFPIEGIYTRDVIGGKSKDRRYDIKFLETSSPGLRGQSGGPIFDVRGTVWAVQSKTKHFALGFRPKVKRDGKDVEENQFLNVGWGVHPEVIVPFMRDSGVEFKLSDY